MKKNKPDYILLLLAGIIVFFGLFILAGAASVGSEIRFLRQIVIGLLPGGIIAFILFKTPLSLIQKWAPYFLLLNLILLLLLFVPFLSEVRGGAARWLSLGPFAFQPAEFLKLTFILYLSGWLVEKTKKRKTGALFEETFLPFLAMLILIGTLLILQPDLSTLVIIFLVATLVYFAAKTPLWHSAVLVMGGIASLFLLIKIEPYRISRIVGALNPDIDPLNTTYHLRQLLITVGSGGITGLGIGMSQQKFGLVPKPATDSIFAILAEETGFIGGILLIFLFFAFFIRAFLIAKNNRSGFARLAVLGICCWIFIQTSVNIGVVIGLLPVTGIPLPLVSYGSSHLVAELAALGIVLNASQYVRK